MRQHHLLHKGLRVFKENDEEEDTFEESAAIAESLAVTVLVTLQQQLL